MLQLVELAQVLLPAVVDDVEQYHLFKLFHHALALGIVGFLEVAGYVVHPAAVGYGHHDALIQRALRFIHLLYYGPCHGLDALGLAFEVGHGHLEGVLGQVFALLVGQLLVGERHFHGENLEELFFAALVVVLLYDVHHAVPDDVGYVHADAFAHQSVAAFLVDHCSLLVHHVVVFEQPLAYAEVVFLYLLLRALDAARYHRAVNHVALLEPELVHHLGNALRGK